jgi:hypothetical protein
VTAAIRSPGRKATAKALEGKPTSRDQFHFYRGKYPQVVAEDHHFCKLFQEWKNNGGLEDDPLVQLMRVRWIELTKTGEA